MHKSGHDGSDDDSEEEGEPEWYGSKVEDLGALVAYGKDVESDAEEVQRGRADQYDRSQSGP